jgi:hypothetical protein
MYAGRDGSRAFISGDFTESGLTDDVIGLTAQELHSLHKWSQFYHKQYKYKGSCLYSCLVQVCSFIFVHYKAQLLIHNKFQEN